MMFLSSRIFQQMSCRMCMHCRTHATSVSERYMHLSLKKPRHLTSFQYANNISHKKVLQNRFFYLKVLPRLFVTSTKIHRPSDKLKEDTKKNLPGALCWRLIMLVEMFGENPGASRTLKNTLNKNNTKWLTVPNILTFGRLLVSPYIGYLVLQEQFTFAFGLVLLAGVTDSLDGWIARKFEGQSSNIGSYIDPLADKVLISILTVSLTIVNVIPWPLCILIIARDLLLVATSSHFHYKHLEPPKTFEKFFDFESSKVKMEPTLISKYNTFFQLGLVGISSAAPVFGLVDHPLLHAYWYLVASTTVLSGLSYVVKDKSAYIIK